MTRDIDEQNLTAYALGELQSPDDRAAIELRLAAEPAARRQLEQVRATATALADVLAEEFAKGIGDDDLRLTDLQRAAIERRLVEPRPPARRGNGRHWPVWGSIAASMAIVATVTATVVVPLLRGTLGGAGRQSGIRPGGADVPTDLNPPAAIALPGGPDTRSAARAGGATRPSWADFPTQWPSVPDVPFPGAGAPARGGTESPHNPGFVRVADRPVSPCPIGPVYPDDVGPDRGSFAAIRKSLDRGESPPASVVRTEELINALAGPHAPANASDVPALEAEVAACPWAVGHRLVRIAVTTPRNLRSGANPPVMAPATQTSGLTDVSLRVEFNPATTSEYRLIGYDDPDARPPTPSGVPDIPSWPPAQLAAGQSLTVVFEVIPAEKPSVAAGPTLAKVVLCFRDAPTRSAQRVETRAPGDDRPFPAASLAFRAAAAAAAFGIALRDDTDRGSADYDLVLRLLGQTSIPADTPGEAGRLALLRASEQAKALTRTPTSRRNSPD